MDSGSLALGADHRSRGWTFVIAGPASRVCTTPGPARSQSPEERQTAACLVRGFAGLARCFQRRLFVGARVRQVFPATGRAFLARLAEIVWYPALRTQPRRSMMVGVKPRRVVILAFAGVQPLDVVGRAEVFSVACRLAPGAYTVEVVACEREPIFTGGGYGIVPAATTAGCHGPIDTLMVAGGVGVKEALEDAALVGWVRAAAGRSRRVTSVCSGAFLLAAAGLLDGRRVTTHWAACEELQRRYPEAEVDPKPIFVRDGEVWTSAGVTAGIDLALAWWSRISGGRCPARSRAGSLCSCGGRAARRSSALTWQEHLRRASRCASCRAGWPITSMRTSASTLSLSAPR